MDVIFDSRHEIYFNRIFDPGATVKQPSSWMWFLLEREWNGGSVVANESLKVFFPLFFDDFNEPCMTAIVKKNWHAKFFYSISVLSLGQWF